MEDIKDWVSSAIDYIKDFVPSCLVPFASSNEGSGSGSRGSTSRRRATRVRHKG